MTKKKEKPFKWKVIRPARPDRPLQRLEPEKEKENLTGLVRGEKAYCLDAACYSAKEIHHRGAAVAKAQEAIAQVAPAQAPGSPARPATVPPPTAAKEKSAEPVRSEATQEVPPPAEPAAPRLPWDQSTITLTVTYWPSANGSGRSVVLAIRANQEAPIVRMSTESRVLLEGDMADLLTTLREKYESEVSQ